MLIGLLLVGTGFAQRSTGPGQGVGPVAREVLPGTLHDEVAALLDISSEELFALRQEGMTLEKIAASLEVDLTEFMRDLMTVRNVAFDQALAEGRLSEAQAFRLRTRSASMVQTMLQHELGPNGWFTEAEEPVQDRDRDRDCQPAEDCTPDRDRDRDRDQAGDQGRDRDRDQDGQGEQAQQGEQGQKSKGQNQTDNQDEGQNRGNEQGQGNNEQAQNGQGKQGQGGGQGGQGNGDRDQVRDPTSHDYTD